MQRKCYFACEFKGPLHSFPSPSYPHEDRFNKWKSVLGEDLKNKGNDYIHKNVRLCRRHFEGHFHTSGNRLTANSIPTLNLFVNDGSIPVTGLEHQTVPDVISVQIPSFSRGTKKVFAKKGIMKLPSELSKLKIKLLKERLKCKTYKQMIKKAERNSQKFLHVIERFPETSFLFTKMQQQHIKKPRGRRFSIEEKILALSLYKQSPKAYNFMQRIFVLPSKRSLQQVLNLIPVEPGMNNVILENLKRRVKKLPEEKKLCTLIFDEVALTPGMQYSNIWDQIMGLEYPESGKHIKIADHALVFMIKGIKAKFKQPLCFTFCQGATKKEILKTLITDVIKKIHSCGLKVVATICDQGGPNMSAINSLYIETKEKYMRQNKEYQSLAFEVDDIKVFPIFDSPHLIKGIRNNFLEKNVRFIQGGKVKIAKWEHLKMLLDVDVGEDDIRMLNKLTEHHVIKEKIPKMKVKNAAQVFSQRVSATLRFLAKHNILPKECEDTAEFLFIFDKLFDAFNGHSYQESSKLYKSCLKVNSIHHKLWDDCLPILRSMQFETMGRGDGTKITKFVQVPSIKNWIKNILVFKEMINYTKNKYNVTSLLTRNFNQDPLENFFSSIRSNGVRNVSPTCWQFVCAFKTLLVNNFNSVHAVGANCEKDSNKALQCLKHLLRKGNKVVGSQTTVKENHCIDPLLEILSKDDNKNDTFLNEESKRYVGGFIVKKCKKIFKNCLKCNSEIRKKSTIDSLIYERDQTKRSLNCPSDKFHKCLTEIFKITNKILSSEPERKNIKAHIKLLIGTLCDFSFLTCLTHKDKLVKFCCNLALNITLSSWCTTVNRILNGKSTNFNREDNIKLQAEKYYKTRILKNKKK